ncbi:MAG TPA: hypothetical protein VGR91_17610 [Stellaceae bacterium]|nr:hypothetical protein [Stellaceae bacterium]
MIWIMRGGGNSGIGWAAINFAMGFSMRSTRRLLTMAGVLAVATAGVALAQTAPAQQQMGPGQMPGMTMPSGQHPMAPGQMQEMMRRHQGMMPMAGMQEASMTPTSPGQDAFGAIQEVVRMLKADPKTDWSKVNLEALRRHLIDMNEVTLKAAAAAEPIPGGIRVAVTGTGRTIAAIKRMVPDQAAMIEEAHPQGWSAKTQSLPNGVILTVTAGEPKQVEIIRGLGFIGVMASGNYHQVHHLAMAKGEFMHMH